METFQVYRDIQARTGGDVYIGVVAVSYTHLTLPTTSRV